MKPTEAVELLKAYISAQVPAFLWGAPGIGKSSVVQSLAEDMGYELIDLRLSQMEPVDLLGLPNINNNRTTWSTPSIFPTEGKGILFLDEANGASREVLSASYQLVLDRSLGEYHLPDDWVILLAGNREQDQGVTTRLPAPLCNRMAHIDFDLNLDDWTKWAVGEGDINQKIISFIRYKPDALHSFTIDHKAWPSPRTWEKVNDALKFASKKIEFNIVSSLVGPGTAAEYTAFVNYYNDLPSIDEILKKPTKVKIPTEPAALYALSGMLGQHIKEKNVVDLMKCLKRLPVEFQVPAVRDAVQRDSEIVDTDTIAQWIDDNSKVFLCD
jgi:hypothetical protein